MKKKQPNDARLNTIFNQAIIEIDGFEDLFNRFKRNLSILGRSEHTFND